MHLKHCWYWYLWIYWIRLCHTHWYSFPNYLWLCTTAAVSVWCTAGIHVLPRYMCVSVNEVVSKEYLSISLDIRCMPHAYM